MQSNDEGGGYVEHKITMLVASIRFNLGDNMSYHVDLGIKSLGIRIDIQTKFCWAS